MIPSDKGYKYLQVISQGHVCFIRQENDIFFLECGPDLENFWKNYFDLNTDYEKNDRIDHAWGYIFAGSCQSREKASASFVRIHGDDHYLCYFPAKDDPCDPGVGGSPLQPVWDKTFIY